MIKCLPAMLEIWIQSLGQEDPSEKEMAIHSSILAWEIPLDRGTWWGAVHGVTKSRTAVIKVYFEAGALLPQRMLCRILHIASF